MTKRSLDDSIITPLNMETEELDAPQIIEKSVENVLFDYNTLLLVLQYLKLEDLLRAGYVCTMWSNATTHHSMWKTVRLNNFKILNFEGMANALQKYKTVHLDLRKMVLPRNDIKNMWRQFSNQIKKVESLRTIQLRCCPAFVVKRFAASNPKLEVIIADKIDCISMNFSHMNCFNNLQELRIRYKYRVLISEFTTLSKLKHLKHLSLTDIFDLDRLNIEVIADLVNLESLELGYCSSLPETFGSQILIKLIKLRRLRLETGVHDYNLFEILKYVKSMPRLTQLELVHFRIKNGFDKALGACTNIKKLLILTSIARYSPTTNKMIMGGAVGLHSTLSHFVWIRPSRLYNTKQLFLDRLKTALDIHEIDDHTLVLNSVPDSELDEVSDIQKSLVQRLHAVHVKVIDLDYYHARELRIADIFE